MGTNILFVVVIALFMLFILLLLSCIFDVLMVRFVNATFFLSKVCMCNVFSKICVVFSFVLVFRVLLVLLKTFLFPYTRVYGLSRVGCCGFVIMFLLL